MDDQWSVPPVERSSTTEQVHRALRDAIVDGTIPQGAHLRELHLAALLGTSRSTIREGIRHLVQEGLAEYELHRGTFVRALSVDDRLDVYVAREAIEVGADAPPDRAAASPTSTRWRRRSRPFAAPARGRRRPTERMIAADLSFHQELVRLVGSPRLDRAFETLAAETRMLLRHHPVYPWRTYVADHEVLLDGLRGAIPSSPGSSRDTLRLSADLIVRKTSNPYGCSAGELSR